MKKITGILAFVTLLGAWVAYGQIAKSFPAGSPVADKAGERGGVETLC